MPDAGVELVVGKELFDVLQFHRIGWLLTATEQVEVVDAVGVSIRLLGIPLSGVLDELVCIDCFQGVFEPADCDPQPLTV